MFQNNLGTFDPFATKCSRLAFYKMFLIFKFLCSSQLLLMGGSSNFYCALCYPKPNEYNLQTTKTNLSNSGNTILVRFCHYKVIVGLQSHAKDIQSQKKNIKCVYTINMINKLIVPPAGLPNEGLRKKLYLKHWLYTSKNLLIHEVFFLRAARSN